MQRLLFAFILLFAASSHAATRYVNPAHSRSQDSDSGSSSAPYNTISYAMNQLASGDHLVTAAGTYRETMDYKFRASNVTVEGSPGTVVKGSESLRGGNPLEAGASCGATGP